MTDLRRVERAEGSERPPERVFNRATRSWGNVGSDPCKEAQGRVGKVGGNPGRTC